MKITAVNSKQINFCMNYMDTPVILGVWAHYSTQWWRANEP
jgi:hypothetical protein